MKLRQLLDGQECVPCPLCGGTQFKPLARTDRYRMGITTAECSGCGFIMTNPMPTAEGLADFYRNHYRKFYQKEDEPSVGEIRRWGMDVRAEQSVDFLAMQRILNGNTRVLDVGCGYGALLRAIHDRCPDAQLVGVEPGAKSAAFVRRYVPCEIYSALDQVESTRTFDLVIVNHVLEHVRDPIRFLKQVRELIGPNGRVYIDVPDAARYDSLVHLHIAHLYHFTAHTLRSMLKRVGLTVSFLEEYSPPSHPVSIRCLAQRAALGRDEGVSMKPVPPRPNIAAHKIRDIGRGAWRYHFRNSRLLRLVVWPFRPFLRLFVYAKEPADSRNTAA